MANHPNEEAYKPSNAMIPNSTLTNLQDNVMSSSRNNANSSNASFIIPMKSSQNLNRHMSELSAQRSGELVVRPFSDVMSDQMTTTTAMMEEGEEDLVTILVPVADGCDDIEVATITEVLCCAEYRVLVLSIMPDETVRLARGLTLICEETLENYVWEQFGGSSDEFVKHIDAIVLPGGVYGANAFCESDLLIHLLQQAQKEDRVIAASGACPVVILARYGMLRPGSDVTCWPSMIEELKDITANKVNPKEEEPVCWDAQNAILTGQSPWASIAFALCTVAILSGENHALMINDELHAHCDNEIHSVHAGFGKVIGNNCISMNKSNKQGNVGCVNFEGKQSMNVLTCGAKPQIVQNQKQKYQALSLSCVQTH